VETELGTTYGHGGWYPGYNSQLEYFPDREFAVAIQINRDFDNPRQEYIQALAAPIARMLAMLKAP
jgi:D-alanyl-D-alanine carboxypeptidase